MRKSNPYIDQIVEREIMRRIEKGELFTPEMVDADLLANVELWSKIWTCAINRALGIGKKRIEEKINVEVDSITEEFFRNKRECNGDQSYAISVVDREYNQIMED